MERLAAALGAFLAEQLQLDEERREVLTYGALVAIQTTLTAVAVLVGAAVLGVVPQVLVVMAAAAALRHVSGGAHLGGSLRCTAVSTLALVMGAALAAVAHLHLPATASAVLRLGLVAPVVLVSWYWVFRYAPVPPSNRSIRPAHLERLRRWSLWMAGAIAILCLVGAGVGAWWAWPLALGSWLEAFTLTPAGRGFAHWMDALAEGR